MSAAPVEYGPEEPARKRPKTLLDMANDISDRCPGYRVEIIGGQILVSPPPDAAHARALTKIMVPFIAAGLDEDETSVVQGVGLWLPDMVDDFAVPDLSVVDADIDKHLIKHNCYDPICFRLVLEVTSSNFRTDLRVKVAAYAEARVPVYVVVDRKHQRLHVLTDPAGDEYASHRVHAPGEIVALPDSVGAKVTLDVAHILKAGSPG
ncbi:Uma2 family endonuclease [Streptomyces sp. NPDC052773]|jgi:Uma2 family endonuclease|uniref:Uma2 family endonuclease n=1 Tax=Streptomyces sp. NPDC052773 TaxID=3365693 RepID=UPI0037D6A07D